MHYRVSRHCRTEIAGSLLLTVLFLLEAQPALAERRLQPSHIGEFRAWMLANKKAPAPAPAITDEQSLGAALYSDPNLSLNRNQSCASCHSLAPVLSGAPGFVDPDNVTNATAVSKGSVEGRFGTLNAPSAAYAAFSPAFHWDGVEGLYVGGQFWNGRAANLQAQAAQPFLNPSEMALPSKWAFVSRLRQNRSYRAAFETIYGIKLESIPGREGAPAKAKAPAGVPSAYDAATKAIAEFEKSRLFNRFTSKFDFYLAGTTELSPEEKRGLDLFNGKARCAACHVSEPTLATDGTPFPPLFTDFTYDNIGVPRNTRIPGNPEPNPGLGGREDIAARSPGGSELGKHKVMSLRNIAITPPYAHNGVFTSLEQITHFYNTRDVLDRLDSEQDPAFGVTGWPAPEVPETVNADELGNLGLTDEEEAAVVLFMKTLTDGYPDWGADPNVPPGTPSPFAATPLPPFP
ncbi:MAG: cytochrome c peroxidase [Verrucomicrobiota bacterium]